MLQHFGHHLRHRLGLRVRPSGTMAALRPQWNQPTEAIASAVNDFNGFLADTRARVLALTASCSSAKQELHVVIGNEAADADSIVSALVFARHLHCLQQQSQQQPQQHPEQAEPAVEHVFVPVVAIPRDEFELRCDVSALVQTLQLDIASVFFVDDFPWEMARQHHQQHQKKLLLTLLDHNVIHSVLAKRLGDLPVQVEEILDHHVDLGQHADALRREVAFEDGKATVASCCTLVAERIQKQPLLCKHELALLSTLLVAVIALDSINFNPKANKVTPRDVQVAQAMEPLALASKEDLFEWLHSEKHNLERWKIFSLRNCLRCDYKDFEFPGSSRRYGVSSVLIDLATFVSKATDGDQLQRELTAFCQKQKIAFLVVMSMTMTSAKTPQRQILFFFPEKEAAKPLQEQLVEALTQRLGLELSSLELDEQHHQTAVMAFAQANAALSRKQVVPLIQQALQQIQ